MAVSVKLAADIDRRLRALAKERNSSHHYMMCEAIRRFVEDEEARLVEERGMPLELPDASDETTPPGKIRRLEKIYRSYQALAE